MAPGAAADPSELAALLAEVRRIDVQSRRLVTGVMAGGYTSVFRGSGIEFDEVREYEEGDDPRSVDWNVTARMGRPFVKKYTDEREMTVVFLADVSPSMDGGLGVWSARQTAARVCACLALSAVRNGDKTGLVAFSGGVDAHAPAKKGFAHGLRIVRDCLALRGASDGPGPAAALEFTARAVRRRAVVFVLSDFLTEGFDDALALCARRHDVVAVRLLLPELAPGFAGEGMTRVRDPETGRVQVADWGSGRVREEHARRAAAWRARTEQSFRRAKVDLMDVPVPRRAGKDLLAAPILRFFRMRELRGAKR